MDYETEQLRGRRGLDLLTGHIHGYRHPVLMALGVGVLLTLLLLSVMALAREPELSPAVSQAWVSSVQVAVAAEPGRVFWLVLDPARPVDEVLPPLEQILEQFKREGAIADFDPKPQWSDPTAVPAVRVVAAPGAYDVLHRLPGVLDAVATLPPATPVTGEIGTMAVTGMITGVVTDAHDGQPVAGAEVRAYDAVSYALLTIAPIPYTDANGQYSLTVTAPYSRAKVLVSPPAGYVSQWYDGKGSFYEADAVALRSGGAITGINLALARMGSISVTLSLEGEGVLPNGVWVHAYEADDKEEWHGYCTTNSAGHCARYLVPGTYKLSFWDGAPPGVVHEWYEDQDTHENATPIVVTSGVTTGISAQVSLRVPVQYGTLRGLVTDESSGSELAGIVIMAFDASGTEYWCDETSGFMGPDGKYQCDLDPGRYLVRFHEKTLQYRTEYYDDALTIGTADWVTITGGMTTTVDAALTPYTRTGAITGTITQNGGQPLESSSSGYENVRVDLYDAFTGDWLGTAYKFYGDGFRTTYSTTVPAGTYKVRFSVYDGLVFGEWYNDVYSKEAAGVVTVADGGVTPDISADLVSPGFVLQRGCIRGRVTSNGVPVQGCVFAIASRTEPLVEPWGETYYPWGSDSYIASHENGVYQICDLAVGDYTVSFSRLPSATTWYSDALSAGAATTVTVQTNTTTDNVDGTLDDLGACISGRVVDGQGEGTDARFQVLDAAGNRLPIWYGCGGAAMFAACGDTDWCGARTYGDGGFVACGLQPGTYTVWVHNDAGFGTTQATVGQGETKDVGDIVIVMAANRIYLPLVVRWHP
jgi:hypothetical protein